MPNISSGADKFRQRSILEKGLMKYQLKNRYYDCFCGGKFYVLIGAKSYGIAPCLYLYKCEKCGKTKIMACREEVRELSGI